MEKCKHKKKMPMQRPEINVDDFEYNEDNFELLDFGGYDYKKMYSLLYEWSMNKVENQKKKLIIRNSSVKNFRTTIKRFGLYCCALSSEDSCSVQSNGRYSAAIAHGHNSQATTIGGHCIAVSSGNHGKAVALSNSSVVVSTGVEGTALLEGTNFGCYGVAVSTGMHGVAGSDSDNQHAISTGIKGSAFVTGGGGIAITTGTEGKASALRDADVAISTGMYASAKGALGAWIVVAGYRCDGAIECIKSAQVDGVSVKPDVYYRVVDGELVEAQDPPVRFVHGSYLRRK